MTSITIELHSLPGDMPDADTDVLVWAPGDQDAQLGAYVGPECSDTGWVDAQGECVKVVRWAELPRLPNVVTLPDRSTLLPLNNGRAVYLGGRRSTPK